MVDFKLLGLKQTIERSSSFRARDANGPWTGWQPLTPGRKAKALTRLTGDRDDAMATVLEAWPKEKRYRVELVDVTGDGPEVTTVEYQFK